jgi:DDE superfamily endonuclease
MSIITYESIQDRAEVFRATTSLDRIEFDKLKGPFERAYHKKYPGKAKGFGRPEVHLPSIEDKLLFILFYFKCYPIQELLGFLFGMSQERANELVHSLSEVLLQALKEGGYVPERLPESLKKSSLKM